MNVVIWVSAIGAVRPLYGLGYNVSIAVWVGMIALMGLAAETGVRDPKRPDGGTAGHDGCTWARP